MRTRLMTATIAALATAVSLSAQAPQTRPQTPPPATPPSSAPERQQPPVDPQSDQQRAAQPANSQVITIVGCLKEETTTAGERANPASRAAGTTTYVISDVKMAPASTVSGIALGPRYEVGGVADTELKKHLNHQVEITGTITQPTPTGTTGNATPNFKGTSVKMLSATCPAAQ